MKALIGIKNDDGCVKAAFVDRFIMNLPWQGPAETLAPWSHDAEQLRRLLQARAIGELGAHSLGFTDDREKTARRFGGPLEMDSQGRFLAAARVGECELVALYTASPASAASATSGMWTFWQHWSADDRELAERVRPALERVIIELRCARELFDGSRELTGSAGQDGRRDARRIVELARAQATEGRDSSVREALALVGVERDQTDSIVGRLDDAFELASRPRERMERTATALAECWEMTNGIRDAIDARITAGKHADASVRARASRGPRTAAVTSVAGHGTDGAEEGGQ